MSDLKADPETDDPASITRYKERLRDVKKLVVKALEALKATGFLADFEVTRKGLVIVRRGPETDKRPPIY